MGSPWKALSDDNRRRIISLLKEKDIENNASNVEKCILTTLAPEGSIPSFYLVMNVHGIQIMI